MMELIENGIPLLIIPSNTYGYLSLVSVLEELDKRARGKNGRFELVFK